MWFGGVWFGGVVLVRRWFASILVGAVFTPSVFRGFHFRVVPLFPHSFGWCYLPSYLCGALLSSSFLWVVMLFTFTFLVAAFLCPFFLVVPLDGHALLLQVVGFSFS